MPLALTLRTRKEVSPFMRQLRKVVTAPGGSDVYLFSGYFSDFLLDDKRLLDSFKKGSKNGTLTMIGGMFKDRENPNGTNDNYDYYLKCIRRLRDENVRVKAYKASTDRWHAKIAIKFRGGNPIATIVGSSNFTQPAAKDNWANWNFESDITIWLDEEKLNKHFKRDNDIMEEEYGMLEIPSTEQYREPERLSTIYKVITSIVDDPNTQPIDEHSQE